MTPTYNPGHPPFSAALPRDIAIQLNATDHAVLNLLAHMLSLFRKRNPAKREYICPGESWIATRLDRCRQTISESVQKLQHLGLIRITRRRQFHNRWQTNLYKYGYWLLRIMGRVKEAVLSRFLPCRVFPTHSKRDSLNSIKREAQKDFSIDIIKAGNDPSNKRSAGPEKLTFELFYQRHPELKIEENHG